MEKIKQEGEKCSLTTKYKQPNNRHSYITVRFQTKKECDNILLTARVFLNKWKIILQESDTIFVRNCVAHHATRPHIRLSIG